MSYTFTVVGPGPKCRDPSGYFTEFFSNKPGTKPFRGKNGGFGGAGRMAGGACGAQTPPPLRGDLCPGVVGDQNREMLAQSALKWPVIKTVSGHLAVEKVQQTW